MSTLFGIPIIASEHATMEVEDWSGCRSPSRARRRLAQGHPQHMVKRREPCMYLIDGSYFAHPEVLDALRRRRDNDAGRVWP